MSHSNSPDQSAPAANTLFCGEDASKVVQDTWISDPPQSPPPPPPPPSSSVSFPISQSPPSDANTINRMIDSEPFFMPLSDYLHRYRHRSIDITARQDSINWILKVHAYHHFKPITALLSVNYFDRFLSSYSFPPNGWAFQLLSVACLSLAAKMEETNVPLLLDLQVLEPGFIFEPKTVQRMELWVMSNLNWRLHSITPLDYLHFFISKIPSCSSSPLQQDNSTRVFNASSDLIISTARVIDFLGFPPSTVAAAAVVCAAGESFDTLAAAEGHLFHERVNKEMVRSCHQLMEEYLVDTCPSSRLKVSTPEPPVAPPSPVGVLDAAACRSCDTRSENPGFTSRAEAAEPSAKRLRPSAPDVQQP